VAPNRPGAGEAPALPSDGPAPGRWWRFTPRELRAELDAITFAAAVRDPLLIEFQRDGRPAEPEIPDYQERLFRACKGLEDAFAGLQDGLEALVAKLSN